MAGHDSSAPAPGEVALTWPGRARWLARGRSRRQIFRAAVDQVAVIRDEVVATGTSADANLLEREFELLPNQEVVHGYVRAEHLDNLVARFGLRTQLAGNVVVQVVDVDQAVDVNASAALTALDLAGADDPRERAAGRRYLDETLSRYWP